MEEDKKLLEEMKENCLKGKNYDDKARYLKAQAIENILNELDRLQKENEELKRLHIYIQGMRNGKELLKNTLTDYNDLSIKVLKLQSITRYTIDDLIDLFLEGYTLKKD